MSEFSPDRARLLAIRTYLQLQLAAVDTALARLTPPRQSRSANSIDPRQPRRPATDPFTGDRPDDDGLTGTPGAGQPDESSRWGGVMASAGSAQAAASVHCTGRIGALRSVYDFSAFGCGFFTDIGGPYAVEVDSLSAIGFSSGP